MEELQNYLIADSSRDETLATNPFQTSVLVEDSSEIDDNQLQLIDDFIEDTSWKDKNYINDVQLPSRTNQIIMRNLGLVSILHMIIKQYRYDTCQSKFLYKKVLAQVYGTFIRYIRLNKHNQAEVQDNIDSMYV